MDLGTIYTKVGYLEDALVAFERAIEINPKYADAFYGLGAIRYIQSEYESALVAYKKVIEINPRHTKAHNGLGKIYALAKSYCQQAEGHYQQEDYASACVAFEQAIKINPEDADAYYGLGTICHRQGDIKSALIAFKGRLRLNQNMRVRV